MVLVLVDEVRPSGFRDFCTLPNAQVVFLPFSQGAEGEAYSELRGPIAPKVLREPRGAGDGAGAMPACEASTLQAGLSHKALFLEFPQ